MFRGGHHRRSDYLPWQELIPFVPENIEDLVLRSLHSWRKFGIEFANK